MGQLRLAKMYFLPFQPEYVPRSCLSFNKYQSICMPIKIMPIKKTYFVYQKKKKIFKGLKFRSH